MSAWGAASKSCNSLLLRIENNDPSLIDLVILPSKTFGGLEVERLAAALKQNTHLISLSASGHSVPPESLKVLGRALVTAHLKRIAIGDNRLGNDGVLALFGESGFCALEGIDLAYKNISHGATVLGKALGRSSTLVDLNLSRNPLGDAGLVAFCEAAGNVLHLPSLQSINLSDCHIGPAGIESLSQLLIKTGCKTLDLSSNALGTSSSLSLRTLAKHTKLRKLCLQSCAIGDVGVGALCEDEISTGVQILDLSYNSIGEEGAFKLAIRLRSWHSLKELNLANNSIGQDGMIAISDALRDVEVLDATHTNCCALGAAKLVCATGLKSLRLFNNKLKLLGFQEIANVVSETRLLELDLGANEATSQDLLTLLIKIRMTNEISLRLLEIGANESSSEVEDEIKLIKEEHPHLDIARDRARDHK